MDKLIDPIRNSVKHFMSILAKELNQLSRGKITPNMITYIGLFAHFLIAYLIVVQKPILASIALIIFGLFDSLDGQLARLQKKANNAGMLLDATTDRMKEIIIYSALAYYFIDTNKAYLAVWVVLACGGSLLVSYVKAKGETAVKDTQLTPNQINRLFSDGFLRYEIRMFFVIIGLLSGFVSYSVIAIAILAWFTAIQRLINITNKL